MEFIRDYIFLSVGVIIGMFIMSLCRMTAKEESEEELYRKRKEQ